MGDPRVGVASDVWVTSSTSILTTNEPCTDSGDHIMYIASVHEFWDFNKSFTVECSPNGSGSWSVVTDYVVWWAAGRIVFNTARTPGVNNFVRIASGSYYPATQLDECHTWTLNTKGDAKNTTKFQSTGAWARYTPTLKSASGKIDTWRNDGLPLDELNNLLGIQLFVDKANNIRFQFYALVQGGSAKSNVNDVQEEGLSFMAVRDVYFLTS